MNKGPQEGQGVPALYAACLSFTPFKKKKPPLHRPLLTAMVTTALSLSSTGGIKAEANKGILRVLLNIQNTGLVFGKQRKGNKRSGCCLFPSDSRTLNKSFTLDGLLAPQREDGVY